MGKLLTAELVEIEFEKQDPENACEWCIHIRIRKKKQGT